MVPGSGTRLGAYEILTLIGSGGMGEVSTFTQGPVDEALGMAKQIAEALQTSFAPRVPTK